MTTDTGYNEAKNKIPKARGRADLIIEWVEANRLRIDMDDKLMIELHCSGTHINARFTEVRSLRIKKKP